MSEQRYDIGEGWEIRIDVDGEPFLWKDGFGRLPCDESAEPALVRALLANVDDNGRLTPHEPDKPSEITWTEMWPLGDGMTLLRDPEANVIGLQLANAPTCAAIVHVNGPEQYGSLEHLALLIRFVGPGGEFIPPAAMRGTTTKHPVSLENLRAENSALIAAMRGLRADLLAASEALGQAWLAGGKSLAEAIRLKTAALERLAEDEAVTPAEPEGEWVEGEMWAFAVRLGRVVTYESYRDATWHRESDDGPVHCIRFRLPKPQPPADIEATVEGVCE